MHSLRDIKQVPFNRPQEHGTISNDSNLLTDFMVFLIRTIQNPIHGFQVVVHPSTKDLLLKLYSTAQMRDTPSHILTNLLHDCVWSFLSNPTREFKQKQLMCPLTRFFIAWALVDNSGTFAPVHRIPPVFSKAQWCFRATGCEQIFRKRHLYDGNCFEYVYFAIHQSSVFSNYYIEEHMWLK